MPAVSRVKTLDLPLSKALRSFLNLSIHLTTLAVFTRNLMNQNTDYAFFG